MKKIQAQLNDFKKHAENAEQVAQQAERRTEEVEKNLRVEKGNAATMIAEACRQLRLEVDERTTFAMILDDFERHLPAGEGTSNVQQEYSHTPGPSSTTVERENTFDNDRQRARGVLKCP